MGDVGDQQSVRDQREISEGSVTRQCLNTPSETIEKKKIAISSESEDEEKEDGFEKEKDSEDVISKVRERTSSRLKRKPERELELDLLLDLSEEEDNGKKDGNNNKGESSSHNSNKKHGKCGSIPRAELRQRAEEEVVPVAQDGNGMLRASRAELRRPRLDQEVLELLKHRILNDRVHDQDERGPQSAPERGDAVLAKDVLDRLEDARARRGPPLALALALARGGGRGGLLVHGVHGLRGLDDPDGVADDRGGRACDEAGEHGLEGAQAFAACAGFED